MRKWLLALSFFLACPVWADAPIDPLLNMVTLQLSAEQWVTTKTALVTVGVNASVSDNDIGKIQSQVKDKLNALSAKGEWHILSFNRNQDQSGLEKIQLTAQARLPESELSGMRDKAKAISKPGETFTVDNVEFIPSNEEVRAANTALRADIYQQAKDELAQLNKVYSDQKYYLHDVNFLGLAPIRAQRSQAMMLMQTKSMGNDMASAALAVGDKLKLSATVTLSSAPNSDVIKMIHN